ncbi:MAG: hypothetical protein AB1347_05610 [Acidobacteriota bacterium]
MTGRIRRAGVCVSLVLGLVLGLSAWAEGGPEGRQNALEAPAPPVPRAACERAANSVVPAADILIYADDYYHAAPNTFLDQALQYWGLPYAAYYDGDFAGFEAALELGGPWTLVLFGNDNYGAPESVLDALQTYVAGGGKLILNTWVLGWYTGHPLWTTLGVGSAVDNYDPPAPVYWWDPSHPFFTDPMAVPELTSLSGYRYGTYGQFVEPLPGFEALAGYTGSPSEGEAAVLLGNDGRTVYKAFLDGQNDADLDGDLIQDGVELWINLVRGVREGMVVYDVLFQDDLGRSQLCIAKKTGHYIWSLNSTGALYTGVGEVANGGTAFWTLPEDPNYIYSIYDSRRKRARAYFSNTEDGVYSSLVDRNTTNNEGECSTEPQDR